MKLSIVIPVFNEERSIPLLKERLNALLKEKDFEYEVIFVDDGSTDKSCEIIKEWVKENHRIILTEFSRNFGHQQAITAGLSESTGDCLVILDADLQDPPEEILKMIEKWNEGYQIVFAERLSRKEGILRKMFFALFYKIFVIMSDLPVVINSGVFGLMDRVVVTHLLNMKERNRFIPGMQGWVGFKTATIYYERQDRKAGKPKQTTKRLFKYAFNAIFSFSYKPLRISFVIGLIATAFFSLYGMILIFMRIFGINVVRGFTTPTVAIFFIGGLLLISNGIIGEYIARIYDEVKNRPLYIITRKTSREQNGDIVIQDIKES
jgi:glycosyltransferase involved in cell wall biosynthesis